QPGGDVGAGVDRAVLLDDSLPRLAAAGGVLGGQCESRGGGVEDGRTLAAGALARQDLGTGCVRGIGCYQDLGPGDVMGRELNLQRTAEVLLLDVDEDEGAAGCGHDALLMKGPVSPTGCRHHPSCCQQTTPTSGTNATVR